LNIYLLEKLRRYLPRARRSPSEPEGGEKVEGGTVSARPEEGGEKAAEPESVVPAQPEGGEAAEEPEDRSFDFILLAILVAILHLLHLYNGLKGGGEPETGPAAGDEGADGGDQGAGASPPAPEWKRKRGVTSASSPSRVTLRSAVRLDMGAAVGCAQRAAATAGTLRGLSCRRPSAFLNLQTEDSDSAPLHPKIDETGDLDAEEGVEEVTQAVLPGALPNLTTEDADATPPQSKVRLLATKNSDPVLSHSFSAPGHTAICQ
ncbi:hypothetical protein EJB05_03848, partial [Eragrostis curvula]